MIRAGEPVGYQLPGAWTPLDHHGGRTRGRRSQGSQGEAEPGIFGAPGAPRAHQAPGGAPGLGQTQGQAPRLPRAQPGSQERTSLLRAPGASQEEEAERGLPGAHKAWGAPKGGGARAPWSPLEPPGAAKRLAKQSENLWKTIRFFIIGP